MELADALVATVRRLEEKGYNHGRSGNISVRLESGMLITPTGANAANLSAQRLVAVDAAGHPRGGVPSSEWHMHQAIYQAYPAAASVVHTHADASTALACRRLPLPAFHYMVASFGGADVRCARYATFGTEALGASAVEALRERKACLLANHGMIAVGRNLEEAFDLTEKLETLARQYLLSLQGGEPAILPAEEMRRVGERYGAYGVGLLPG